MDDNYYPPFSMKIVNNFLEVKYYNYLLQLINSNTFLPATQGVNGKNIVQEEYKIRLDYTLNKQECSFIDKPLIEKSDCGCTLRERWRLLFYDGDNSKKAFRDQHTDWTKHACHRRMSIIIGLSDTDSYEGGELYFKDDNVKIKLKQFSALIFDGKLVHEVLPVVKGKRYVLQSFLFDESGWNIKINKSCKSDFLLMENKIPHMENKVKTNHWIVKDNLNAVYNKHSELPNGFLGTFNSFNELNKKLEEMPNIHVFTWHSLLLNNKKWAGKAYGFTKNDILLMGREDINSWKYEKNVISGISSHSEIISSSQTKTLSVLSCDGGPGNQLIGIKEGLIMAKYLNREFIFPPILQHYIINCKNRGSKENIKTWNFDEIYNYKNTVIKNQLDVYKNNNYTCYCMRNADINNKLRSEILFNKPLQKLSTPVKQFSNKDSYSDFITIEDNDLLISHLFNSTKISLCYWNGCDICEMDNYFLNDYKNICKNLDFSEKIKTFALNYIKKIFNDEKFITIHMRYPDTGSVNIKEINKIYNEIDIDNYIISFCKKQNIKCENVFICTSNQNMINNSPLKKYHMLKPDKNYTELESFIEQYICCLSEHFFYTGGVNSKSTHIHLRSTWSSFVIDYRQYLINNENNYYLSNILSH